MSFIYGLQATWNSAGTIFEGIQLNVDNGQAGTPVGSAMSRLINLKNNNVSVFSVDLNGDIYANNLSPTLPAIQAESYGVVGDGTTNNTVDLNAALVAATGKKLVIGPGTFVLDITSLILTVPGNILFQGSGIGVTILKFITTDGLFHSGMNMIGANVEFRDMTIQNRPSIGGAGMATLNAFSSDNRWVNVEFDGGLTNSGATLSQTNAICMLSPDSGSVNDLYISRCRFHNFGFTFLKNITSTCSNKRMTVLNCEFYNNYLQDLSLNSPLGVFDDVIFANNVFRDPVGYTASISQLYMAFASITNFVAIGNEFTGQVEEAIHVEQASYYGVVANNNINCTSVGIRVQDNNAGGTSDQIPDKLIITNNVCIYAGTPRAAGTVGVQYYNAGSAIPATNIFIGNNICERYEIGIQTNDITNDNIIVSENSVNDSTYCYSFNSPNLSIRNNSGSNSTYFLQSISLGGIIYNTTIFNCTNLVALSGRPIVFSGISWSQPAFLVGPTVTVNKVYWSSGVNERLSGRLTLAAKDLNVIANVSTVIEECTWSGLIWDHVRAVPAQEGGTLIQTTSIGASFFQVSYFNSSGVTTLNVVSELRLDGTLEINPTFVTTTGSDLTFIVVDRLAANTTTDPGQGSIIANKALKTTAYVLASLATPASMGAGARMYISDCTAPSFSVTASGGGATGVVVYSDGVNWRCG